MAYYKLGDKKQSWVDGTKSVYYSVYFRLLKLLFDISLVLLYMYVCLRLVEMKEEMTTIYIGEVVKSI